MPATDARLAAVDDAVRAQVQRLRGLVALLKDVGGAQDKYAGDLAKLPLCWRPRGDEPPPPSLARVTGLLERVLGASVAAHGAIATEIHGAVVGPLEAFARQQQRQTKQLLAELDESLQREGQHHGALQALLAGPTTAMTTTTKSTGALALFLQRSASSSSTDNQELEAPDEPDATRRRLAEIDELRVKRTRERALIRQRLEELELTAGQQQALCQSLLRKLFDVFEDQLRRLRESLGAATIVGDERRTSSSLVLGGSSSSPAPETVEKEETEAEDAEKLVMIAFDRHLEATAWMTSVFAQLLPIEEAMIRRLQGTLRGHRLDIVQLAFAPSLSSSSSSSSNPETATTLGDALQSHRQRTVNLADPIARTLRFSRHKQETIHKELLESMAETERLVQHTRTKLQDKDARLVQLQQRRQISSSGVTTAAASTTTSSPPKTSGIDGTIISALGGSRGLRQAVAAWGRQLQSPSKAPGVLLKSKSSSSGLVAQSSGVLQSAMATMSPPTTDGAELADLERDRDETHEYLVTLEKNARTQRREMINTLQNTSFLAVKTMELMVQEHIKNLTKALGMMDGAIARCQEQARRAAHPEVHPWTGFRSMIGFEEDPIDEKGEEEPTAKSSPPVESETPEDEPENNHVLVEETMGTRSSADPQRQETQLLGRHPAVEGSCPILSSSSSSSRVATTTTTATRIPHADWDKLVSTATTATWRTVRQLLNLAKDAVPSRWVDQLIAIVVGLALLGGIVIAWRLQRLHSQLAVLATLQQANGDRFQQLVQFDNRV